jgi:hypothetical protein
MYSLSLLPLHALAVPRGDGLHPKLLAALERRAPTKEAVLDVERLGRELADRKGRSASERAKLTLRSEDVLCFPAAS